MERVCTYQITKWHSLRKGNTIHVGKKQLKHRCSRDENPRKLELGRRAGGDGKQRLQLKETPQVILTHGYVRVP